MRFNQDALGQLPWCPVVNYGDEPIPPWGAMQHAGIDSDGMVRVLLPDRDNQTRILFNGFTPIFPGGGFGQGVEGVPMRALFDPELGDDPQFDEIWGVKAGSWKLSPSRTGFKIMGGVDNAAGTVVVTPMDHSLTILVKVLSTTKQGIYYPAQEMIFDTYSEVLVDGASCWLLDLADI